MEKEFDFNRIGKRMPYTAPDGFLDDIERNVLKETGNERVIHTKRRFLGIRIVTGTAVAAAIVLFFVLNNRNITNVTEETEEMFKVEQAFNNLSVEDQDYMLEIYQNDIFLNE